MTSFIYTLKKGELQNFLRESNVAFGDEETVDLLRKKAVQYIASVESSSSKLQHSPPETSDEQDSLWLPMFASVDIKCKVEVKDERTVEENPVAECVAADPRGVGALDNDGADGVLEQDIAATSNGRPSCDVSQPARGTLLTGMLEMSLRTGQQVATEDILNRSGLRDRNVTCSYNYNSTIDTSSTGTKHSEGISSGKVLEHCKYTQPQKAFQSTVHSAMERHNSKVMLCNLTHTSEKPFLCAVCSAKFKTKVSLIYHTRTHTGEKPFSCAVCPAKFSRKPCLVVHTRTHTGEKPFSCTACTAMFRVKSSLVKHLRTHSVEKPFSCAVCPAKFRLKSNIVKHLHTHSGEKPFSCSVCPAMFKLKNSLVKHLRTHTGEKPFSCAVCSAKFNRKVTLITHSRIHTGEKPFLCSACPARFSRKDVLIVHTRTHTKEKPFFCTLCPAKFSSKPNLVVHTRTHSKEKL